MKTFASATASALLLTSACMATPVTAAQEGTRLMATLPSNMLPLSEFYKEDVYYAHDSKIGDVRDVLLGKSGQVAAAHIGCWWVPWDRREGRRGSLRHHRDNREGGRAIW